MHNLYGTEITSKSESLSLSPFLSLFCGFALIGVEALLLEWWLLLAFASTAFFRSNCSISRGSKINENYNCYDIRIIFSYVKIYFLKNENLTS